MAATLRAGLLSALALIAALAASYFDISFQNLNSDYNPLNWNYNGSRSHCRSIPGDADWPSVADWATLNATVGGSLIANVPIGAVCRHSYKLGDDTITTYDEEACDALRDNWFYSTTHIGSSSSPMAYPFTNNSCNPFVGPDAPCTVGYHSTYTVNVSRVSDIQSAVRFSKENNVRLVIRNSGHDYLGKSTGAHALSVWTHHLKSMQLIETYQSDSSDYQGPAIKMGAGIEVSEAYEFASSHNLMVVGGNCPNVAMAGGYTQGGGISLLSSKYGLAADQVLTWEVVLASGELVTASPTENPDLFWALRGGGGGTFGIVVSMTAKAFPDTFFSSANLIVANNGENTDDIFSAVGTYLKSLPSLVDAGAWVVSVWAPIGFMVLPALMPGMHPAELDAYLAPTRAKLDELGLEYQYSSVEHVNFLAASRAMAVAYNVSDYHAGGRLVPRELVQDDASIESLVGAIRHIGSNGFMAGVAFNVAHAVDSPDDVAVNPHFRKSLFNAAVGLPIDYSDDNYTANNKATQDKLTYDLLPALDAIMPEGSGGAYLSETDFQDPNFKSNFYGGHYNRLLEIKQKYDPDDLFYAKTAVGSDRWEQKLDGRLCMV